MATTRKAAELYRQSLNLAEELGDKKGIARSLHQLASIHQIQGNHKDATKLFQQSLKLKRDLGDEKGIATSLNNLGKICEDGGYYEKALENYIMARSAFEKLKDPDGEVVKDNINRLRGIMGEDSFKIVLEKLGALDES